MFQRIHKRQAALLLLFAMCTSPLLHACGGGETETESADTTVLQTEAATEAETKFRYTADYLPKSEAAIEELMEMGAKLKANS